MKTSMSQLVIEMMRRSGDPSVMAIDIPSDINNHIEYAAASVGVPFQIMMNWYLQARGVIRSDSKHIIQTMAGGVMTDSSHGLRVTSALARRIHTPWCALVADLK